MISGGIADKTGNTYEAKCVVRYLLDVIQGKSSWIQYETIDTSMHGIDFTVSDGSITTHYQVKRNASGGNWTAKKLIDEGIITTFFNILKFSNDIYCSLITQNDASVFKGLLEKARIANNLQEFTRALNSNEYNDFEKCCLSLNLPTEEKDILFQILSKIELLFLPERTIDEFIASISSLIFNKECLPIFPALRDILENNYNKKMTTDLIRSIIKEKDGVLNLKDRTLDTVLPQQFVEKTDMYLSSYSPFGFDGDVILRSQAKELFLDIIDGQSSVVTFLTGTAGSGKSGVIRQLIENLRSRDIPCLAFRVDHYLNVISEKELGKAITGREESPIVTIKGTFPDNLSVVIIDQLDAISEVSGRNGLFKEIVIAMIQKAALYGSMKIILVCRTFDIENDSRLKLLEQDHKSKRIEVPVLNWDNDIVPILKGRNVNPGQYSEQQKRLLCLPVNFSIFLRIDDKDSVYFTRKALFDKLFEEKQRKFAIDRIVEWSLLRPLFKISELMSKSQMLSVSRFCLDEFTNSFEVLSSEGFIIAIQQRIHFFHESLFDYLYARNFINTPIALYELLLSDEQYLFRRTQVRQILENLRSDDFPQYISDLSRILLDANIRYHIKLAVCQWLSTVENPCPDELKIILQLESDYDGISNLTSAAFFSSSNWLPLLVNNAWLKKQLYSNHDVCSEQVLYWLMSNITLFSYEITSLISNWMSNNESNSKLFINIVKNVAYHKGVNTSVFELINLLQQDFPDLFFATGGSDLVLRIIDNSQDELSDECILLLSTTINQWIKIKNSIPFEHDGPVLFHDTYIIKKIIKEKPLIFIKGTIEIFIYSINMAIDDEKNGTPHNDFYSMHDTNFPVGFNEFIFYLRDALKALAGFDKNAVLFFIDMLDPFRHKIFMLLVLEIIPIFPEELSNNLITLIDSDDVFKAGYDGAAWLPFANAYKECVPYFSNEDKITIEQRIRKHYPEFNKAKSVIKSIKEKGEDEWYNKRYARYLLNRSGYEQWCILETIGLDILSANTLEYLYVLRRKFSGVKIATPNRIMGGYVLSPISIDICKKMSDAQWLSALTKYKDKHGFAMDLKGGAPELGRVLMDLFETDVSRFLNLVRFIPDDILQPYLSHILWGISKAEKLPIESAISFIKRIYQSTPREYVNEICEIIGKHSELAESEDIFDILKFYTLKGDEDENLEKEESITETIMSPDSLSNGIPHVFANSGGMRCHAWGAIAAVLWAKQNLFEKIWLLIDEALQNEPFISVRCRIMGVLTPIFNIDKDRFIVAIEKITELPETSFSKTNHFSLAPLVTYDGINLFPYISSQIPRLADSIVNKLRKSTVEKITIISSYLIAEEYFRLDKHGEMIPIIKNRGGEHRIMLALVAGEVFGIAENYQINIDILHELFNDPDEVVRKQSAIFLKQIKPEDFEKYMSVILDYINSPAFNCDDDYALFELFKNTKYDILDCLLATSRIILGSISKHKNGLYNIDEIIELLKEYYVNTESRPQQRKEILDMIDLMLENNIYGVEKILKVYDR